MTPAVPTEAAERTMEGDGRHPVKGRPVVFGEVLFDHFPDGNRVLGGAPFNVAWHLNGFGHAPLFVSRLGVDAEGGEILKRMEEWEMDRSGVQLDRDHPTGAVRVSFDDEGSPSYEILVARAWDCISPGEVARVIDRTEGPGLLAHGTLALRSDVSRRALLAAFEAGALPLLVDINLRPPWWSRDVVDDVMARSRWVKMNDEELRILAGEDDLRRAAEALRDQHDLEAIVITQGEKGALAVTSRETIRSNGQEVGDLVDTVGAGDAFTAVLIAGLIRGWTMRSTLDRAVRFAAEICRRQGATHLDMDLYRETLADWSHAP